MNDADKYGQGAGAGENTNDSHGNLHERNTILQVLLDYLPSGVTLFGPDLEMIACNAKVRELLDFPDHLFAHGLPSLLTLSRFNAVRGEYGPGDPEEITAAVVARARKMEPHVFERTRPNGIVLDVRGTPLPGGGFVTIYTDITERKLSEQALRDSAEKLRLFTDNVPAMTVSFDENLRCLFANKRYLKFFGSGAADIIGKHLREIIGESVYSEVERHYVQVLQGHPVRYERTVKLPIGEPGYLEVKLLPHIGAQGQTLGCFAVATDVTEHKLVEERIQRTAHHDSLTGLPNRLLFNVAVSESPSYRPVGSGDQLFQARRPPVCSALP